MSMIKSNLITSLYLVLITAGNKSNASVKPNSYSFSPYMCICVGKFWFKLKSETTLQFSRNKKKAIFTQANSKSPHKRKYFTPLVLNRFLYIPRFDHFKIVIPHYVSLLLRM